MSDENRWIEVTVVTSHEAVEAVSEIFYNEGVTSVAIEDPNDIISSNKNSREWDYIEDKLIPKNTKEAKVKGYFLYSNELYNIIERIKDSVNNLEQFGLDKGSSEVTFKEVKEEDWANNWKQYYKPFKIGKNIVIKPSWENYEASEGDIVIELDPGMAFGTGSHETTRMCIELLQKYVKKGCVVFDVGCGSGILSIVSSKLGAGRVVGVDIDEAAVRSSMDNVKISSVNNVEIKQGNLLDVIKEKADVIVANIIADVIIDLSGYISKFLNPGGIFICSGIIKGRLEDVKKAVQNNKFEILELIEQGEWVAMALKVGNDNA